MHVVASTISLDASSACACFGVLAQPLVRFLGSPGGLQRDNAMLSGLAQAFSDEPHPPSASGLSPGLPENLAMADTEPQ